MSVHRGDVVIVRFPFSSGVGAKVRPPLVVQGDRSNARLTNVILAVPHDDHAPPAPIASRTNNVLFSKIRGDETLYTLYPSHPVNRFRDKGLSIQDVSGCGRRGASSTDNHPDGSRRSRDFPLVAPPTVEPFSFRMSLRAAAWPARPGRRTPELPRFSRSTRAAVPGTAPRSPIFRRRPCCAALVEPERKTERRRTRGTSCRRGQTPAVFRNPDSSARTSKSKPRPFQVTIVNPSFTIPERYWTSAAASSRVMCGPGC